MENFQDKCVWIRDPDTVCPEWLDPDPVNIRPNPKPCLGDLILSLPQEFIYIFCHLLTLG